MGFDMKPDSVAELLKFTKELARDAGQMIREAFAKPRLSDYERKACATDPVTETDKAVEALIFDRMRERYPSFSLIGEESASDVEWTDEPTFIVDPIDGTANFIHRIPMCAVSIGFTCERKFVVGVIYNPILDEMFEASHLTQSKLNGKPIKVSSVSDMTQACVTTEVGSDRSNEKIDWVLTNLKSMLRHEPQSIRMMGSCSLNMANLACGRTDLIYERGIYAWDMAAGVVIIRQAGGIICGGGSGFDPKAEFDLTGRCFLAYTPSLKDELNSFN